MQRAGDKSAKNVSDGTIFWPFAKAIIVLSDRMRQEHVNTKGLERFLARPSLSDRP